MGDRQEPFTPTINPQKKSNNKKMGVVDNATDMLKRYKGPLAGGAVGVVLGLLSKHVMKKDTIRVGTLPNSLMSFGLISDSGILGQELVERGGI